MSAEIIDLAFLTRLLTRLELATKADDDSRWSHEPDSSLGESVEVVRAAHTTVASLQYHQGEFASAIERLGTQDIQVIQATFDGLEEAVESLDLHLEQSPKEERMDSVLRIKAVGVGDSLQLICRRVRMHTQALNLLLQAVVDTSQQGLADIIETIRQAQETQQRAMLDEAKDAFRTAFVLPLPKAALLPGKDNNEPLSMPVSKRGGFPYETEFAGQFARALLEEPRGFLWEFERDYMVNTTVFALLQVAFSLSMLVVASKIPASYYNSSLSTDYRYDLIPLVFVCKRKTPFSCILTY